MTTTAEAVVLVAEFSQQKETPGTMKFVEDAPDGEFPISGSFYLKKPYLNKLGNPARIRITVEAI